MAQMIPVTADQYVQALAFRESCHVVATLLAKLEKARVKGAGSVLTVFSRQAKQIDDLPAPPQTAMAAQKLKQLRKLRGNAIVACDLLDRFKENGVALAQTDIWTPLRTMNTALNGIPDENGRPYVAGQKHDL